MRNPSFSIIVPTYQRRDMLCETVRALGRLDYDGPVEVIIVIDGSTDGTAAALSALECPFPLKVVEQPNRGLASARNRGAKEASGDILLFLDDDMLSEPDLLLHHARSYRDGADAVIGDFIEPLGLFSESIARGDPRERPTRDVPVDSPFGLYGGHMSVRRSAFELVDGFDENFTVSGRYGYEDTDIAYRLLRSSFAVRRNQAAVCEHVKRISPREYIGRGRSSANAEQYLLKKHPELLGELSEWAGANRISVRLRRFVRLPFVPRVLANAAILLAELGSRTMLRSNRKLLDLCNVAYTVNYWSTVQRTRGIP